MWGFSGALGVVFGFCRLFLFRVAEILLQRFFFHEPFVSQVPLNDKCALFQGKGESKRQEEV